MNGGVMEGCESEGDDDVGAEAGGDVGKQDVDEGQQDGGGAGSGGDAGSGREEEEEEEARGGKDEEWSDDEKVEDEDEGSQDDKEEQRDFEEEVEEEEEEEEEIEIEEMEDSGSFGMDTHAAGVGGTRQKGAQKSGTGEVAGSRKRKETLTNTQVFNFYMKKERERWRSSELKKETSKEATARAVAAWKGMSLTRKGDWHTQAVKELAGDARRESADTLLAASPCRTVEAGGVRDGGKGQYAVTGADVSKRRRGASGEGRGGSGVDTSQDEAIARSLGEGRGMGCREARAEARATAGKDERKDEQVSRAGGGGAKGASGKSVGTGDSTGNELGGMSPRRELRKRDVAGKDGGREKVVKDKVVKGGSAAAISEKSFLLSTPKKLKDIKKLANQYGDLAGRTKRLQRVEDLFDALEAASIIKIQRVSPQRMLDEKMAVPIASIDVLAFDAFVLRMNKALDKEDKKGKADPDRKQLINPNKLVPGVRETFRYLGILPSSRKDTGLLDWETSHYVFDNKVRAERLARATIYARGTVGDSEHKAHSPSKGHSPALSHSKKSAESAPSSAGKKPGQHTPRSISKRASGFSSPHKTGKSPYTSGSGRKLHTARIIAKGLRPNFHAARINDKSCKGKSTSPGPRNASAARLTAKNKAKSHNFLKAKAHRGEPAAKARLVLPTSVRMQGKALASRPPEHRDAADEAAWRLGKGLAAGAKGLDKAGVATAGALSAGGRPVRESPREQKVKSWGSDFFCDSLAVRSRGAREGGVGGMGEGKKEKAPVQKTCEKEKVDKKAGKTAEKLLGECWEGVSKQQKEGVETAAVVVIADDDEEMVVKEIEAGPEEDRDDDEENDEVILRERRDFSEGDLDESLPEDAVSDPNRKKRRVRKGWFDGKGRKSCRSCKRVFCSVTCKERLARLTPAQLQREKETAAEGEGNPDSAGPASSSTALGVLSIEAPATAYEDSVSPLKGEGTVSRTQSSFRAFSSTHTRQDAGEAASHVPDRRLRRFPGLVNLAVPGAKIRPGQYPLGFSPYCMCPITAVGERMGTGRLSLPLNPKSRS